jgi:hypothetical protein
MTAELTGLFVRIPRTQAERLAALALQTGTSKQAIVGSLLAGHMGADDAAASPVRGTTTVITLVEAAELLRLEPDALRRRAERGDVPGRCFDGDWRFVREALLQWLAGGDAVRTAAGFTQ